METFHGKSVLQGIAIGSLYVMEKKEKVKIKTEKFK